MPTKDKNYLKGIVLGSLPILSSGTRVVIHNDSSQTSIGVIEKQLSHFGRYRISYEGKYTPSFATLDLPPLQIEIPIVSAPVLDDIVGIAVSLSCMKEIIDNKIPIDTYVIVHRAEEIGMLGAYTVASNNVLPKECLVVSVDTASVITTIMNKEEKILCKIQ